jgi:hypothetical protein
MAGVKIIEERCTGMLLKKRNGGIDMAENMTPAEETKEETTAEETQKEKTAAEEEDPVPTGAKRLPSYRTCKIDHLELRSRKRVRRKVQSSF